MYDHRMKGKMHCWMNIVVEKYKMNIYFLVIRCINIIVVFEIIDKIINIFYHIKLNIPMHNQTKVFKKTKHLWSFYSI